MAGFKDLTGIRFTRLIPFAFFHKNKRIYWKCKCDCGNIKEISSSKLINGNTKSCGCFNRDVASKRMKESNPIKNIIHPMLGKIGSLSPNYGKRKLKPRTPELLRVRMSSVYSSWRRSIFIRDEFTCTECGKKNIYIVAHHKKSFAHYPDLRFDLNNGKTLCDECHKKTDNFGFHKKLLHDGTI